MPNIRRKGLSTTKTGRFWECFSKRMLTADVRTAFQAFCQTSAVNTRGPGLCLFDVQAVVVLEGHLELLHAVEQRDGMLQVLPAVGHIVKPAIQSLRIAEHH